MSIWVRLYIALKYDIRWEQLLTDRTYALMLQCRVCLSSRRLWRYVLWLNVAT